MRHARYKNLSATALIITGMALSSAARANEPTTADEALSDCPVAAYTMGLRYQQQSAEIRALQRQS